MTVLGSNSEMPSRARLVGSLRLPFLKINKKCKKSLFVIEKIKE